MTDFYYETDRFKIKELTVKGLIFYAIYKLACCIFVVVGRRKLGQITLFLMAKQAA